MIIGPVNVSPFKAEGITLARRDSVPLGVSEFPSISLLARRPSHLQGGQERVVIVVCILNPIDDRVVGLPRVPLGSQAYVTLKLVAKLETFAVRRNPSSELVSCLDWIFGRHRNFPGSNKPRFNVATAVGVEGDPVPLSNPWP